MRLGRGAMEHAPRVALALLVGGGWLAWESRGSPVETWSRAGAFEREVACVYVARLHDLPPGARTVRIWIPLAKTGSEQRILRRDVRAPIPYAVAQDPDYGNDI